MPDVNSINTPPHADDPLAFEAPEPAEAAETIAPPEDLEDDGGMSDIESGEPSLDRFAAELSAMIEVAASTADSLNKRMHEVNEGESRAAAASTQLQEQLRLGARMLKAFQSQIGRVEQMLERQHAYQQQVADVQEKIEQCFAGIESCIDKTLESVAYRLAELARTAVDKFQQGIAAGEQRLAELDRRIAQCAEGIDGICEMVERVQESAATAAESNSATLQRLEESAAQARRVLSQQEQARRGIASDLQSLRDALEEIEQRGHTHAEASSEAIARAAEAEASLRERLDDVARAEGDSHRVAETVVSLNELLVRLAPWERLLLSDALTDDGLPEPLAKVAGEVRQQISRDMNWLSATMQEVAQRVSTLAQAAPTAPPAPSPRAAAPTTPHLTHASTADSAVDGHVQEEDGSAAADTPPEVQIKVKKPLRLRKFNGGG